MRPIMGAKGGYEQAGSSKSQYWKMLTPMF